MEKKQKKKYMYSLNEAVSHVLEPGSDSELSELDGEDVDECMYEAIFQTSEGGRNTVPTSDIQCEKENMIPIESEQPITSRPTSNNAVGYNKKRSTENFHDYRWRHRETSVTDTVQRSLVQLASRKLQRIDSTVLLQTVME